MKRRRDKRFKGVLKRMVIVCALLGAAHVVLSNGKVADRDLSTPTIVYAQSLDENSASASAFLEAFTVFSHPRCVNCHPAADAPLIGDASRPHPMRIRRGPGGMGENGIFCSTCHQSTNLSGAHMPPGAPGWQLPTKDEPMVFEKRTPRDLCLQLKDPAQNGGRTPKEILEHVRDAPIVLWGWNPGEGRIPVPVPHDVFIKYMSEWVDKGAACPK